MSKFITVLVEVLIFSSIISVIALQVADGGNLSGASLTLYGLTTLFIVIGFIMMIMKVAGVKHGR